MSVSIGHGDRESAIVAYSRPEYFSMEKYGIQIQVKGSSWKTPGST